MKVESSGGAEGGVKSPPTAWKLMMRRAFILARQYVPTVRLRDTFQAAPRPRPPRPGPFWGARRAGRQSPEVTRILRRGSNRRGQRCVSIRGVCHLAPTFTAKKCVVVQY